MEGLFAGKSFENYFKKHASPVFEKCFDRFLKEKIAQAVVDPDDWESESEKLIFNLFSIDEYFYTNSKAPKRARLCQRANDQMTFKEVAQNADSGLPSFNLAGRFYYH